VVDKTPGGTDDFAESAMLLPKNVFEKSSVLRCKLTGNMISLPSLQWTAAWAESSSTPKPLNIGKTAEKPSKHA
jgi:hypothetical protein